MSDTMVIDLSNYKDRVGARVTPGRYRVVVEDVEPDQSKAGNPMINLWFRIIGGDFDGQTLVDRLTVTEKALFRVVAFLNAIGLPTPKGKIQINPQKFLGQRLEVDVDDGEPYNGRVKSEVRGYMRLPKGSQPAAADIEEPAEAPAAAAAATTGAATAATSPESPAPTGTASADAATDDDGNVDLDNLDL
ncbi:single strand DNA binding protein [Microbacterium phage Hendrix]|uniref:DUF669 domain-containing protein n=1 Tax=Microbacterium phage Hendrix TaxID=2182341 RepID=A0A2U8UUS2_9CAUD|nr:single strand DNA binding protein [Microbacterium phage Hendrix]AWN07813.1 hypothetical protein PBI_HENDRIX_142 [Microbacterium phage Hendrix]